MAVQEIKLRNKCIRNVHKMNVILWIADTKFWHSTEKNPVHCEADNSYSDSVEGFIVRAV